MSHSRPLLKAILLDLSGTVHVGTTPTPDAISALQKLRLSAIPFRFCSNTSKESVQSLSEKLKKIGFELPASEASSEPWTSVRALKTKLAVLGLKRPYLLLSESASESMPGDTLGDVSEPAYDSVVVGLAPSLFTYDHLNTAFRILTGEHTQNAGLSRNIPLIATHKAKYIETSSPKGLSLGPGPFVTALEEASGVNAQIVGKPTADFFQTVISDLRLNSDAGQVAVVGDDVEADLGGGAVELGLWRVLVKTGKYRPGDEYRSSLKPPDEIFDSFAAFVDTLG